MGTSLANEQTPLTEEVCIDIFSGMLTQRETRWQKYQRLHPERVKKTRRQNYLRHRKQRLAYRKQRFEVNPERSKAENKAYKQALKRKVVEGYGGKCSCCGESCIEFLTIEHVNHDGAAHRKRVGAGAGVYRDLIRRGFPKDGFTVFCWNCQMATRYGGKCPHKV